jgi:Flp pilus assembly protein TadB
MGVLFLILVVGFIWIVRGLAKADQRRQKARQAGFTEEEIRLVDQRSTQTEQFLSGLIIVPVTFIGMIILSCVLIWVFFPVGILAAVTLWRFYLKWLRS